MPTPDSLRGSRRLPNTFRGNTAAWLDVLRADAVFGWRQLKRSKVASAVAILSLGLGAGACVSAFRLIDALFLRPLPVSAPNRLYALSHRGIEFDGTFQTNDGWAYPLFEKLHAAAKDRADLIAVSYASHADLTYSSDCGMGGPPCSEGLYYVQNYATKKKTPPDPHDHVLHA